MKLSEGEASPVLLAHPGSPVDISRPRPSIAGSLAAQRMYHGSDSSMSRYLASPRMQEENSQKDGVAAKGSTEPKMGEEPEFRRKRSYGTQPFYIPAKVPENEEINNKPLPEPSADGNDMDFEFEEDNGVWISAQPLFHVSRTSLASTAVSTSVDDKASPNVLVIDTSVASSAASMVSSAASIYSAGSDAYGWEEELDRKAEDSSWDQEQSRRWPSGGRTMGPRPRGMLDLQSRRGTPDSKRKTLLHRVLNLSGSRRPSTEDIVMVEGVLPKPKTPGMEYSTISLERMMQSP